MTGRMAGMGMVMAALLAAGCRLPSERAVYGVAVEAVKALPDAGSRLEPEGIRQADISVNKNAACVELPVTVTDANGVTSTRVYVVWCKRIARRWDLDRIAPKPQYGTE